VKNTKWGISASILKKNKKFPVPEPSIWAPDYTLLPEIKYRTNPMHAFAVKTPIMVTSLFSLSLSFLCTAGRGCAFVS
jgi:hypothetical protein